MRYDMKGDYDLGPVKIGVTYGVEEEGGITRITYFKPPALQDTLTGEALIAFQNYRSLLCGQTGMLPGRMVAYPVTSKASEETAVDSPSDTL